MTILAQIKKTIQILVKRPAALGFYLLDCTHDKIILPLFHYVWYFEAKLRGGRVARKGLFLGRPLFKFHPLSKVIIESGYSLISDQRRCSSGNIYAPCRLQTHSASSSIHLAAGVGLNGTSIVSRSAAIYIGEKTIFAPNCVVMDSPFHKLWPPEQRYIDSSLDVDRDVFIGSNCWIGNGCIILPGSKIGNNSVIGARSVVSGEIPHNCLAVGSPAKVIRILGDTSNE